MLLFLGFPFGVAFVAPPAYSPLSLSSGDWPWWSGLQPTFYGGPCCVCLGEFLSVAAVLYLLLPPPARGVVSSC